MPFAHTSGYSKGIVAYADAKPLMTRKKSYHGLLKRSDETPNMRYPGQVGWELSVITVKADQQPKRDVYQH